MKICCISDTHNLHKQLGELPDADILVHCGDITMAGSEGEAMNFMNWFFDQPHKYKIFVGGNHDFCLYGAKINGLPDNCYYLDGESIEIEGLKFHGIPLFMEEFMDGAYDKLIDNIPTDTDVLITHQPPTDIFSGDFGDYFLKKKVNQIKPRYHLFGHAHEQYGKMKIGKTTYINAALVSNHYEMLFKPILIEL